MARLARDIVKVAVQLPERERVQVVERLIASLEPVSEAEVDKAWAAEIKKRSREIRSGTVALLPWRVVRSRARKRARGNK